MRRTSEGPCRPRALAWLLCLLPLPLGGCSFGPKALEGTHARYNDAVRQVAEEQTLLNIVRLRYNDSPARLDVSAIAAQYELGASAEARPFFGTDSTSSVIQSFTRVLPFASVNAVERPTVTLTPLDDPETVRGLCVPATLDGIIFLAETSYPVATVYRLFVEHLNRLPNAPTASGPPRPVVPEFRGFQRAVSLLQALQDRGDIRFVREEKLTDAGSPLRAEAMTAAALVEAARNGLEYRQRPDGAWALIRRDRRLVLKINPAAVASPEAQELYALLCLRPGQTELEVVVGGAPRPFAAGGPEAGAESLALSPRSIVQAFYYMAHAVEVPPEHLAAGLATAAVEADGAPFDWRQVTDGLFAVRSCRQPCRPKGASVAVRHRGYWFYIDDRDADSKVAFGLMLTMTRVNLIGTRKGGPALTLPVGR